VRVARRRRAERFYACGALQLSRAARSTRTLGVSGPHGEASKDSGSLVTRNLALQPKQDFGRLDLAAREKGRGVTSHHGAHVRKAHIPLHEKAGLLAI
jgi:hypothetical protein